ncbi:Crp/Fnr family transcriptional regulator [Anaerotruncus sp. DFI.9.16]|uniref:Crp/Fnr family transcriptional regulator n=1 Tax=Anaerotruncus sp. DFI.9.16 TaxID=2965275 RepID=UPI00210D65E7|nr:Crp/Fnr family transcriptional regulator [Anaerotruncus sp. DFI.9.16]MCQ4896288.1 Crp/Fnr family transcriptional regulator [Anaerotruncus sp. DFI.9.16]
MDDYEAILRRVPLFAGIRPDEWERMLGCLGAVHRRYPAGEFILMAGQPADRVGVLLEGRARVLREEFSGARTILTALAPGDLFAEAFACASGGGRTLPVSVLATSDCRVLLIDYRKIITACPSACDFHARLVRNMLAVLADKNLLLNRRLRHLSKRTTREKLLSYLSEEAAAHGGGEFDIPFDRQGLADYLCVERSAMSAALSKLREEGLLETRRSHFRLLRPRDREDAELF